MQGDLATVRARFGDLEVDGEREAVEVRSRASATIPFSSCAALPVVNSTPPGTSCSW